MATSGQRTAKMHKMRRAFMAWLAVCALFVQALVPLSSAWAFDATGDDAFQVVCTANGFKTIIVGEDELPTEQGNAIACPFCVVHGVSALVPPQESTLSTDADLAKPVFALPRANSHSNLWCAQPRPPRGPPQAA